MYSCCYRLIVFCDPDKIGRSNLLNSFYGASNLSHDETSVATLRLTDVILMSFFVSRQASVVSSQIAKLFHD